MIDDATLLRRYARESAEDAFAELVRRHLDLVYSAALRQLNGDTHLAADAAQIVFADLARKAGALANRPVLAGWLFTSTRFAAAKLVRTEQRRRHREQAAHAMNEILHDSPPALDWIHASPLLDEALAELNAADRDAVLLRFFQGRAFAEIGTRLNLTENAARMRVDRALDKLRSRLARHGVTSTAAALATALATHAVASSPAALAATVTSAGLASAGGSGLVATVFTLMSTSKLPLGIASALVVAGGAGLVFQADANARLRAELSALLSQTQALPELRAAQARLARDATEAADLARDDAEFARLAAEAEALRTTLAERQRAASAAAAARTTPPAGSRPGFSSPQPKRQSAPVYPSALRAAGVEGEVVVELIVNTQGAVVEAKARSSKLTSASHAIDDADPETATLRTDLEKAAVDAVNKWEFVPGTANYRIVNTRLAIPIVFALSTPRPLDANDSKTAEAVWF